MKSNENTSSNALRLLGIFKYPALTILAVVIIFLCGRLANGEKQNPVKNNLTMDADYSENNLGDPICSTPKRFFGQHDKQDIIDLQKPPFNGQIFMRSGTMVISGEPMMTQRMDALGNADNFEIIGTAKAWDGFHKVRCAQKLKKNLTGQREKFSNGYDPTCGDIAGER